MVDYLCLRLSKLTEDILDIGFDDAMRKFATYQAIDGVLKTTPIIAYPVLSDEGGAAATNRSQQAMNNLREIIGFDSQETEGTEIKEHPVSDAVLKEIFEYEVGAPMVDIEDLIKDM